MCLERDIVRTCSSLTRLKSFAWKGCNTLSIEQSTSGSQDLNLFLPFVYLLLQSCKIPVRALEGAMGTHVKHTAIQFLALLDTQRVAVILVGDGILRTWHGVFLLSNSILIPEIQ
jgi:hypothetical protein